MSKPETELRWAKRTVWEEQWFLIEVTKGASPEKILEACLEGDALHGTPHDTKTKQSETDIMKPPSDRERIIFEKDAIDLVEETKA